MKTPLFVRNQPGGLFTVVDQNLTTGDIWFVDSGSATGADTVGHGQNPDSPFVTIDYAIGQCTASQGDIIYVMPGHAETLSAAAAITCDVIGIKIIGLGWGSNMPTLSIDTEHTEEAPISITVDNVWLENLRLVGINAGGSKDAIGIGGGADYCTLKGLVFEETSTDKELGIGAAYGVITCITSVTAIDHLSIINCTMHGLAGNDESFLSATDGTAGLTNLLIDGCVITGTFADDVLQLDAGTNVNTPGTIINSVLCNKGGNNLVATFDTGGCFYMHNLAVFGASGTTIPLVGYDASYQGLVFTCEPGASYVVAGSATNWGA